MITPLPRSEYAVTERYAYMNHAAVGVPSHATCTALDAFVRAHGEGGVLGTFPYENRLPELRARVASFVGADASEIAFLRNTCDGANAIAGGIDWKPGDEVLICDDEFPSNALPWLALRERGVAVRLHESARGRLTPDALRAEISPRTKLVSVSWVNFADGYRCDLAALSEIAHRNGALFVSDVIQGLGPFPLDVRACGLDAAYAGGQKWLMSSLGIAFLYVRADLLDRLRLAAPGWRSQADMWGFLDYDQPWIAGASRFEGGTPNLAGALSLATAIEGLAAADPASLAAHVEALTDRLCEGVRRLGARLFSERGPGVSSGIVAFAFDGIDSVALGRAIQHEERIVTTWRPNGIRVSPHGYNTAEEIDRLLDALARRLPAKGRS